MLSREKGGIRTSKWEPSGLSKRNVPLWVREAGLEGVRAEELVSPLSSAAEPQQDEAGLGSLLPGSCQDNRSREPRALLGHAWKETAVLILALRCILYKLPNYTFRLRSPGGGEPTTWATQCSIKLPDLFGLSLPSTKPQVAGKYMVIKKKKQGPAR